MKAKKVHLTAEMFSFSVRVRIVNRECLLLSAQWEKKFKIGELGIMLSEIRQSEKDKYYMISLQWESKE